MIEVEKGISESGYTEITLNKKVTNTSSIAIKGAFNLMSEIKNGEE
jgi:hypothetical protein